MYDILIAYAPILILVAVVWLTYWDIQSGGWVSDDIAGIALYDGKRPTNFHLGLWWKWVRFQCAKVPHSQGGELIPDHPNKEQRYPHYHAHPRLCHRFSLYLASGGVILLYTFLCNLIDPNIAFLATLLFIVHPLGVQTIGWISGVGYVGAFFFMMVGLNFVFLAQPWMSTPLGTLSTLLIYTLIQFLAAELQFTALGSTIILLFLGQWPFAIISGLIGCSTLSGTLKDSIKVRHDNFNEQNMGPCTKFHPRKLIVVFKSLYYYTKLIFFPKRLGLYHVYGYHYPLPEIEHEDRYFWAGCVISGILGYGLVAGPLIVQLACVWYLAYIVFVLNWITVHQFVSERYAWIPSIGACIIVAAYAPPWLLWLIIGIALMRSWAHLPTYYNEILFYQSNIWNFPQSEVALGNLGAVYLRCNLPGAAHDMWRVSANVNPEYDVPWYNIYSLLRSHGQAKQGREFLVKAINAKTCHFKDAWEKELITLDAELRYENMVNTAKPKDQFMFEKEQLTKLITMDSANAKVWEARLKVVEEELGKRPTQEIQHESKSPDPGTNRPSG